MQHKLEFDDGFKSCQRVKNFDKTHKIPSKASNGLSLENCLTGFGKKWREGST
jgi:hypothetical protein